MDFEQTSHGVSFAGMEQFKSELRTNVFASIRAAARNTTDVVTAVNNGWHGQSADNFIKNLISGGDAIANHIKEVEHALMTELDGIVSQVGDMDENLVEVQDINGMLG